jgi:plasmid stability protein
VKVTIAFQDDELYRRVKLHAVASGRQVRDIVEEALTAWLDAGEDAEDRAASAQALEEYASVGGVDADAYFARMVADGHVSYDPD